MHDHQHDWIRYENGDRGFDFITQVLLLASSLALHCYIYLVTNFLPVFARIRAYLFWGAMKQCGPAFRLIHARASWRGRNKRYAADSPQPPHLYDTRTYIYKEEKAHFLRQQNIYTLLHSDENRTGANIIREEYDHDRANNAGLTFTSLDRVAGVVSSTIDISKKHRVRTLP